MEKEFKQDRINVHWYQDLLGRKQTEQERTTENAIDRIRRGPVSPTLLVSKTLSSKQRTNTKSNNSDSIMPIYFGQRSEKEKKKESHKA